MQSTDISVFMVDSPEEFKKFQEYVSESESEIVSFDLETDSSSEKLAKIFGLGISINDDEAFYIPIRNNKAELLWSEVQVKNIYGYLRTLFKSKKLIGHNIIYDVLVFENNSGYRISDYIYSDTILLKHALDEERPFGLKETSVKYLGDWADKAQEKLKESIKANGGKTTKDDLEMWKADTEILGEYCGWDTVLCRKLFDIFEPRIHSEGLTKLFYEEETMPLYREVTIDMKRRGFTVDVGYFEKLKEDIEEEIENLTFKVQTTIIPFVTEFNTKLLNENYAISRAGSFPKVLAKKYNLQLPEKNGKVTLAKKEIEKLASSSPNRLLSWMLGDDTKFTSEELYAAQVSWLQQDEERSYVFNIKSVDHLRWLFFTKLGLSPTGKTESGLAQCDDDYLETIKDEFDFVASLIDVKKLQKLASTYIDGILDRQIDGVLYSSMLQFGTTSGRYSSTNPNLQNLPRVKDDEFDLSPLVLKYTNAIKKGFIAPQGYKIVNADYSALEPICFAHASGDEKLREVFRSGYDLYSAIAIEVFGITGCSANKKDKNYLKNVHPELRQKAKTFCLAVVYGAEAGRISQAMETDYQSAAEIIEMYLDAYPGLKKYMQRCDYLATRQGVAKTDFGRIRHLPKAKEIYSRYGDKLLYNRKWVKSEGLEETRYILKNALNNSKNFPIQGAAAHIVNRSMIATIRKFKENNIDGGIVAQVHDEITCIAREDQSELAAKILRECMETTTKISVPLSAVPVIGSNWAESK